MSRDSPTPPSNRQLLGVAAGFVAVSGLVWLVLSVLLAALSTSDGSALWNEVLRVGGPPAVIAIVAGTIAVVARR